MKLKKILAGLLAVVMVVSLLPAMLFAVSAEDPIKLPVSGYVYSPLNVNQPVENALTRMSRHLLNLMEKIWVLKVRKTCMLVHNFLYRQRLHQFM